jgi:hypothetical protein
MSISSREISKLLIDLSDQKKYTRSQIRENLRDCLKGKKCCLFSCGDNLMDHSDRFNELYDDNEIVIACWKTSVSQLEYKCDILGMGGFYYQQHIYGSNIDGIFSLKFCASSLGSFDSHLEFTYGAPNFLSASDSISFADKGNKNLYGIDILNFILFLKHLGISEIYLFGFFIADKMFDLLNYSYESDIICHNYHYFDTTTLNRKSKSYRTLERGALSEQYQSSILADWCDHTSVKIYNVSTRGCLSNKIPRIDFDSIFTQNKKNIDAECEYTDIKAQLDRYLDMNYYSKRYGVVKNRSACHAHYMHMGHYLNRKLFKTDDKNEYLLNNFDMEMLTYINILRKYGNPIDNLHAFFSHFAKTEITKYVDPYDLSPKKINALLKKYKIDDKYFEKENLETEYKDYLKKIKKPLCFIKNKKFYLLHCIQREIDLS